MLENLYRRNYKNDQNNVIGEESIIEHLGGKDYTFRTKKVADQFAKEAGYLMKTNHTEVFLEEPECNLFPPTQLQFVNWIVEMGTDKKHKNFFLIATNSPYILSSLLQENLNEFKLFLTYPAGDGCFNVRTATEKEIQQVYNNGSDAFFY